MAGKLNVGLILLSFVVVMCSSCVSTPDIAQVPGDYLGVVKSASGGEGGNARISLEEVSIGTVVPGTTVFSWSGGDNPSIGKLRISSIKGRTCSATILMEGIRPIRRGDAVFAVLRGTGLNQ